MKKSIKTTAVLAAMSVMALGTVMTANAAAKNGWVQEGNTWYYYNNNSAYENQWVESDGKWYFLDEDGKMATKKFIVDGEVYEDNDIADQEDFADSEYYYVDANGVMVTGWYQAETNSGSGPSSSKKWYYASTSGVLQGETWVQSGADWYYLNNNGQMAEEMLMEDKDDDEINYYFKKGGVLVTGWHKLTNADADEFGGNADSGDWIYANADGELIDQGWEQVGSDWYFFGTADIGDIEDLDWEVAPANSTGAAIIGYGLNDVVVNAAGQPFIMMKETLIYDDEEYYYLNKDGDMETSKYIENDNDIQIYANSNGDLVFDGVETVQIETISNKNQLFIEGVLVDNKYVPFAIEAVDNGETYIFLIFDGDTLNGEKIDTIAEAEDVSEWLLDTNQADRIKEVYKLGSSTTR